MFSLIHGNLVRQYKALELLRTLLEEEFDHLQARNIDAITVLEFSIHELLRQIAVERVELKEKMQGTKLIEYAGALPEEDGSEVRRLYRLIDTFEQSCALQASHNAQLSLALMDQSQTLLVFLHEQISPRPSTTYGPAGKISPERLDAALVSGRL